VVPTVLTNSDPLLFEVIRNAEPIQLVIETLPGLTLRDLVSVVSNQIIVLLPFLVARQYLSTQTGMRELVVAFLVGGLIYSIPSLFEVRLSPQINIWVYGFFQHSFEQMMRDGGFRPIVFLPHGLWLAVFMVMALLSATALTRTVEGATRRRYAIAILYLAGVLYLCKSLASLVYGIVFTPVVLLASPKMQIRLAILCALIAVIYPMLRNTGQVPVEKILEQAVAFDPARAQSLEFRLGNEELLLARADEKPWFGWGGWGRGLIWDFEADKIKSIPDGRWIITFGAFGWVGYIAEMGLLALPLFLLGAAMRGMRNSDLSPYVAPIAIILAVNMIDMLLNATLVPITWVCAGAVLGYAERLHKTALDQRRKPLFGNGTVIGRRNKPDRQEPLL